MTRAAIKHAEESLRSAMLAADLEALERLMDDELMRVDRAGSLVTKREDLESYRSSTQRITAYQARGLEIALFGEDTAVVTAVVAMEGVLLGQSFGGDYRSLRTWRRTHEGPWRVIASASAELPRHEGR